MCFIGQKKLQEKLMQVKKSGFRTRKYLISHYLTLEVRVCLIAWVVKFRREKMDWQMMFFIFLVLVDGSYEQKTDCNPFFISR